MGDVGTTAQRASEPGPGALERAHAELLKQSDLQFTFHPIVEPTPPAWLKTVLEWIGHLLIAMAPAFKFIFWGGLIGGALVILYFIFGELLAQRFGWRRRRPIAPVQLEENWKPTVERARGLLDEADRLAAQGRYDEAVHLLLFRSIDDIDERWPNTVRPALTSRDISSHPRLSDVSRHIFLGLVEIVERSFFGGGAVSPADFKACRDAYADFALPVKS